jgi:hypothetical protein
MNFILLIFKKRERERERERALERVAAEFKDCSSLWKGVNWNDHIHRHTA